MKQAIKKGNNKDVYILLHGTGGSATDLFSLATLIDSNATYIGLEGRVLEGSLRRYFKRYDDGSFDLESLSLETEILYKEIYQIIEEYQGFKIKVIGYSNGANIFLNVLKEYENIEIDEALLLHPSPVRMDVAFKRQQLKLLLTSGANDPYITQSQFNQIIDGLESSKIQTKSYRHEWGHQITEEECNVMMAFTKGDYDENNI